MSSRLGLKFIPPLLPTLVDVPPEGDDWIHEIKQDGYRSQIMLDRGKAAMYTRRGHDWTVKYAPIAAAAEKLKAGAAILDGEMVAVSRDGRTNIQDFRVALEGNPGRLSFIAFDLLHLDGKDLRKHPLVVRRAQLEELIAGATDNHIQFSQHVTGNGGEFFAAADRMRLEGIVSKRASSTYDSGRQRTWLKIKCFAEAEFRIIGVQRVPGEAPQAYFAAETGEYVGGAFVALPGAVRDEFYEFTEAGGGTAPAGVGKKPKAVWSKPGLIGRVKFLRGEDHLRHASLKSVRPDTGAINRQKAQREAVAELLERLKRPGGKANWRKR